MSIAMNPTGSGIQKSDIISGEKQVTASTDRPASYISPSRLSLWMRCPRAYQIRYVEGVYSPCTPSLFLGKVVHGALETYYRHLQLGLRLAGDELHDCVEAAWCEQLNDEPVEFDDTQLSQLKTKAKSLVDKYADCYCDTEEKVVSTETPISAPLVHPATGKDLGVQLYGIIDLITQEDYGLVVTDFKTCASASKQCERQHEIQLTAYAYLVNQLTGENPHLEIRQLVKTKTPKIITHRYQPRKEEHVNRFFAIVEEYLDALTQNRITPRPGFGCMMCDMQDQCV